MHVSLAANCARTYGSVASAHHRWLPSQWCGIRLGAPLIGVAIDRWRHRLRSQTLCLTGPAGWGMTLFEHHVVQPSLITAIANQTF